MAYIQQRGERKYKITVCNGYTTTGKKRMQARTIDVPKDIPNWRFAALQNPTHGPGGICRGAAQASRAGW